MGRTKRWLSDGSFSQKVFLYLPALVARAIDGDSPPGAAWFLTLHLCKHCSKTTAASGSTACQTLAGTVFVEKPHNPNSEEAKSFRKHARIMRRSLTGSEADKLTRFVEPQQENAICFNPRPVPLRDD